MSRYVRIHDALQRRERKILRNSKALKIRKLNTFLLSYKHCVLQIFTFVRISSNLQSITHLLQCIDAVCRCRLEWLPELWQNHDNALLMRLTYDVS